MSVPTSSRGYTDEATAGGLLDYWLEHVPALAWPDSVRVYSQLRTDTQIKSVLAAYTLPVRSAGASVDPAGCRPEAVALIADDLGLPILGEDAEPGPARLKRVSWDSHLRLAMLSLVYGHYWFEKTYDASGSQTRLARLDERLPHTVAELRLDRNGDIEEVRQHALTDPQRRTVRTPVVKANALLWYAHEKEGSNWFGRSLLRPAYGPWLLKQETLRVHATSLRRFGTGVPQVTAPPGASPQQVAEAQALASAIRVGDRAGIGLPAGFKAELVGLTGSVPDALAFLNYLDQQISRSALTGILDLGNTPNGSRALGSEFVELLMLALQSLADEYADVATRNIAADLVRFNWGENEPVPRIVAGRVGAKRQVTADTLAALLNSGALSADPELEAWVRHEYRLPERPEDAVTPPPAPPTPTEEPPEGPPTPPEDAPPPPVPPALARAGKVALAASSPLRRQPTEVEAATGTDFEVIHAEWESELDSLVREWATINRQQRQQILDAVSAAVGAGQVTQLATLAVDSQEAAALLRDHMLTLASQSARTQAEEAKRQGVDIPAGQPDEARIGQVAATAAGLLAGGYAASAARKALQVWTPEATAAQVSDAVAEHLDALTDSSLRDALGSSLSTAQNSGRVATLEVALDRGLNAEYYSSEVLDKNTCESCQKEDGQQYASLEQAKAAYANGGFSGCQGGLRCRGIVVTRWT